MVNPVYLARRAQMMRNPDQLLRAARQINQMYRPAMIANPLETSYLANPVNAKLLVPHTASDLDLFSYNGYDFDRIFSGQHPWRTELGYNFNNLFRTRGNIEAHTHPSDTPFSPRDFENIHRYRPGVAVVNTPNLELYFAPGRQRPKQQFWEEIERNRPEFYQLIDHELSKFGFDRTSLQSSVTARKAVEGHRDLTSREKEAVDALRTSPQLKAYGEREIERLRTLTHNLWPGSRFEVHRAPIRTSARGSDFVMLDKDPQPRNTRQQLIAAHRQRRQALK